jgi:translation initiation factor 3 subunit G
LLANFGPVARVFVARDHQLGICKGFAFVTFFDKERCQQVIDKLDGFGYDSLILKVDFAKRT